MAMVTSYSITSSLTLQNLKNKSLDGFVPKLFGLRILQLQKESIGDSSITVPWSHPNSAFSGSPAAALTALWPTASSRAARCCRPWRSGAKGEPPAIGKWPMKMRMQPAGNQQTCPHILINWWYSFPDFTFLILFDMICLKVPLASVAAPVAATLRKTLREWLLSEGLSCPGSSYAVEKNKSPTFENLQVTGTLKSLPSGK